MQVHIYLDKLFLTYLHKFLFNKDLKKKEWKLSKSIFVTKLGNVHLLHLEQILSWYILWNVIFVSMIEAWCCLCCKYLHVEKWKILA